MDDLTPAPLPDLPEPSAAPAPPQPAEAPGPSPVSTKKRGRPPGSGDRRPRARKPSAAPPPNPFAGSVAGDAAEPGRAGPPPPNAPDVAALLQMDPSELAGIAVAVGQALVVNAASLRYGLDEARDVMALSKGEEQAIVTLTGEWIRSSLVRLTAGEALALTLLCIYGQRAAVLEARRSERQQSAKVVG